MLKQAVRSEYGQIIIMFAVLVPIFLAMLTFVVNIGQTYLENRNSQQVTDSLIRTINKILSKGSSKTEIVSSVPSGAVEKSYDDLKTEYPAAVAVLNTLQHALDDFKNAMNISDLIQSFALDNDNALYCKVEVNSDFRVVMKYGRNENKVTGLPSTLVELMSALNNVSSSNDRQAVIQALVSPTTAEDKSFAIESLKTILSTRVSTGSEEVAKSELVSALLTKEETIFDQNTKGEIFNGYLSAKVSEEQSAETFRKLQGLSKTEGILRDPAQEILVLALKVMSTVSDVRRLNEADSEGRVMIWYQDTSASKLYHKVSIQEGTTEEGKPCAIVWDYSSTTKYADTPDTLA